MKKTIFILAVLMMVVFSTSAWAGDKKIAYVDAQRVMNESEHGKNVKLELESVVKDRAAKIEALAKERDAIQAEIEKNKVILSEDALREKIEQIKKIEREAERFIQESNEDLMNLQREKESEILKDLGDIIEELGQEGGYDLILPVEVLIYAPESSDITDVVTERYNKLKGLTPSDK